MLQRASTVIGQNILCMNYGDTHTKAVCDNSRWSETLNKNERVFVSYGEIGRERERGIDREKWEERETQLQLMKSSNTTLTAILIYNLTEVT